MEDPSVKKTKETINHEAPLFTFPPHKIERIKRRYWENVAVRGKKECWEWQGITLSNGYGRLPLSPRYQPRAHRLSWVIQYNSPIPKGLHVCHRCDNRICCNVEHLFLGTNATNMYDRDLKAKSRPKKWVEYKIPIADKKKIIVKKLSSKISSSVIARKYKVTSVSIRALVKTFLSGNYDKSWLPEPLKTRYAHCKSWKEVKALKEKYDLEDASSKNESTKPL
jgi:hypothetical protein